MKTQSLLQSAMSIMLGSLTCAFADDTEVTLAGSTLTITDIDGGDSADQLDVSYAAGTYTIADTGGLTIDASAIPGATGIGTSSVTVPEAGINQLEINTLAGGDTITITSVQTTLSDGMIIDGGADSDVINLAGAIDTGATGVLVLSAENISQSASVTVGGTSSLDATVGGTITLDHIANDFAGSVSASGAAITLVDANTIVLDQITASGPLTIETKSGNIEDLDATTKILGNGVSSFTASGDIVLDKEEQHVFSDRVTLSAARITEFASRGDITFDTITTTNPANVNNRIQSGAGTVTFDAAVSTAGLSDFQVRLREDIVQSSGTITTDRLIVTSIGADVDATFNGENDANSMVVNRNAGVQLGDISFNDVDSVDLAGILATDLAVTANDTVTISNALTIAGDFVLTAPGVVSSSASSVVGGPSATGDLTMIVDSYDFATGSIQSSGNLTIKPLSPAVTIGLGGGPGTLGLNDTELALLADGFTSVTIGDPVAGTGEVQIDTVTFNDPVTIAGGTIHDAAGTDIDAGTNGVTLDGTVSPGQSPGTLSVVGNLVFDAGESLEVEFGGTAPSSEHDQVAVTGTVTIGSEVSLSGTIFGEFVPTAGDSFTIIDNDSFDAVTGTFAGLSEGACLIVDTHAMKISYSGGDGNDVTLEVLPTSYEVSSTADSGSGSLREALAGLAPGGTITFQAGLDNSTITLTSGPLAIAKSLTIDASALTGGLTIDASGNSRVLTIDDGNDAELQDIILEGIAISGGNASGSGDDRNGGGIFSRENLTLIKVSVANNIAESNGGGIYHEEITLVASDSEFDGNQNTNGNGGAIYGDTSTSSYNNCSFVSNETRFNGGAIYNWRTGTAGYINCSFAANTCGSNGGAVYSNKTDTTFTNCLLTGNHAGSDAAAFYNFSSATSTFINSTLTGNLADDDAGGVYNNSSAPLSFINTIVWDNADSSGNGTPEASIADSSATAVYDHSLIQGLNPVGTSNLDGTDPSSDPLFILPVDPATAPINTGNARLLTNSPALDVGDSLANGVPLDLDGNPRIQNVTIDLGAYEGNTDASFSLLYPELSPEDDENGDSLSNFAIYSAGGNPTEPFDQSLRPVINESQITLSQRNNDPNLLIEFQKSTTLLAGSWSAMLLGSDYTVETSTSSGGQTIVTYNLLPTVTSAAATFFRQEFTEP